MSRRWRRRVKLSRNHEKGEWSVNFKRAYIGK